MKQSWVTLVLAVLLAVLLAACGTIQTGELSTQGQTAEAREVFPEFPIANPFTGEMVDETPDAWFVQFAGQPTVKRGSAAQMRNQRAAFRSAAATEGVSFQQRYDFQRLFNGISVRASAADAAKLSQLPGVVAVFPVFDVPLPEPSASAAPDMAFAISMTGADIAQSTLGLTGKGVKVGIMDSGIDREHPDFGNRIQFGYGFVHNAYNASDPNNDVPIPSDDWDDCNGHGTHVAGITGANGQIVGVAPDVILGAYKVFGCEGSTSADIMVAAMERALADGMDVLNMSIGSAYQWPQYPTAVASDNLVEAGVVVVVSIGNSGATGVYSAGAPGVGHKVIGVASFDNTHLELSLFEVEGRQIGYSVMSGSVEPPSSGSAPIVHVGRGCPADAVIPTDPYLADPAGKIALIERGACTFASKAQRAANAGAVGVVMFNNVTGNFAGTIDPLRLEIPVVSISRADGLYIAGLSPTTLTWLDGRGVFTNPTGNLISSFSSYGLAPDLTLKPDLGAPGGLITSTYPLEKGAYATLSGTSMSSPHVAGAVALYLEAKPNTRAEDVRGIFQNTAQPRPWGLNPGIGFLDSVHRQGAGMINIPAAVLTTTRMTPAKLELGESQAGPFTTTLSIRNSSSAAQTYTMQHLNNTIATGGNTYTPSYFASFATAAFSATEVTVPAGGSATVNVTITANPGLPDRSVYGGYIRAVTSDGAVAASVPYSGFKGDYQSIQVLVPTPFGFPWLAKLEDGLYVRVTEDGTRFTMNRGDIAYVLAHFEHQSRLVRLEVVPLRQVGAARDTTVFELEYFGRNSTPTGIFAFEWDGSAKVNGRRTALPMGDYQLKLSVLKALGDPNNPAHWETWTSPVITISRSNAGR